MFEIIAIVVVLWLLGVIDIPWLMMPSFPVFSVLGYSLTIERLLIIGILIWLGMSLGSPFRQMLWVFFILWLLSTLGIIGSIAMGTMVVASIILGLILSVIQK
jgi:hypothetical protein